MIDVADNPETTYFSRCFPFSDSDQFSMENNAKMHNLSTDTIVTSESKKESNFNVDLDLLFRIENNLEFYEKVSLVFILYDNANVALQDLLLVQQGSTKQLLPQWATIDIQWREKLEEALCLIQNYFLLITELHHSKDDIYVKYLPFQADIVTHIPKWKKVLYRICEDLSAQKKKEFLNELRKTYEFPNYDLNYFELYFIYMETCRIIKNGDLSKLLPALKMVDYEFSYEMAKKITHENGIVEANQQDIEKSVRITMGRLNKDKIPDFRSHSDSMSSGVESILEYGDLIASAQAQKSCAGEDKYGADEYYQIDPNNPGLCLIINNEFFYTDQKLYDQKYKELYPLSQKLQTRDGSACDRDALTNLFTAMRYQVDVHENLTADDMLETVASAADSVKGQSSLFVFLMSHGLDQLVFGSNSMPVHMADMRRLLYTRNSEYLMSKPKILVIQACQGQRCQDLYTLDADGLTTDNPDDSENRRSKVPIVPIPKTRDLCELYASVSGYSAIRSTHTGSWLIQSLCDNIRRHAHKSHFADICTYVITECSETKKWYKDEEVRVMVPTIHSTFGRKFRLPKIYC